MLTCPNFQDADSAADLDEFDRIRLDQAFGYGVRKRLQEFHDLLFVLRRFRPRGVQVKFSSKCDVDDDD